MDLLEFRRLGWCDCELEGIAWAEEGRDLLLTVRVQTPPNTNGIRRVMRCCWADQIKINLIQRAGRAGQPLSWDAFVHDLPDGRVSLHFDFASMGDVRLCCNEIEVSTFELEPD